jgi:hypothetical protein
MPRGMHRDSAGSGLMDPVLASPAMKPWHTCGRWDGCRSGMDMDVDMDMEVEVEEWRCPPSGLSRDRIAFCCCLLESLESLASSFLAEL